MTRILISGYYGFGNIGDEAILLSLVGSFRGSAPDLDLVVLSGDPGKTERDCGARCIPRSDYAAILREISDCDLFFSGGGGLFQDVTGIRSLAYYLGLVQLAEFLGKKVVIGAQGIGPVETLPGREMTRFVVSQADLVIVRDEASSDLLQEIGIRRKDIAVTADPALLLSPSGKERLKEILDTEGIPCDGRPLVALSFRKWQGMDTVLPSVVEALDEFLSRTGALGILIPFQESLDKGILRQISEKLPGRSLLVSGTYTPSELAALISAMDLVVAMRLHACIFAAAFGSVPIGIAYDPKVRHFLERVGAPVISLSDVFSGKLGSLLDQAWERQRDLRDAVSARTGDLKEKAHETIKMTLQLLGF
ncbi:MAG: polysaccharide pyruvyl transferase CsaB [Armatimonadetes bacterium]|nr:polysaccharide pyruvyl transferase CsaB [Armatimonadota bacterium]